MTSLIGKAVTNKHCETPSYVKPKPALSLSEQQWRRSDCVNAQSDLWLCCSLSEKYNTFYNKILANI